MAMQLMNNCDCDWIFLTQLFAVISISFTNSPWCQWSSVNFLETKFKAYKKAKNYFARMAYCAIFIDKKMVYCWLPFSATVYFRFCCYKVIFMHSNIWNIMPDSFVFTLNSKDNCATLQQQCLFKDISVMYCAQL